VADENRRPVDPDLGPRWTDGPLFGERPGEGEAIQLLSAATPLPSFSAVSAQRVWRRLGSEAPRRRWLRPAVLLGLVLAAGGAAAASLAVIRGLKVPAAAPLPLSQPIARRSPASPASSATLPPPPLVIRAADVPPPKAKRSSSTGTARPRRAHLVPAAKPVASAASATEEGTLGKETTLFREALSLRAARNTRAAIAVLDHYAALYPQGSYASEVVVLRGELAADAGDCAAAGTSFDRALAAPASPGLEERALYGRAACHAHRGEEAAAQADYRRYLERFPHGRFTEHARTALRP
jgi:TolA-binding protein